MKIIKKITAVALIGIMSFLIVACNSKDKDPKNRNK